MRLLIALHRWLGVALCAVFCAWFLSGLLMMYEGYPELSERQKVARSPRLDASEARVSAQRAFGASGLEGAPAHARVGMVRGRPAYLFYSPLATWVAVYADTGAAVAPLSTEEAVAVARAFSGDASSDKSVLDVDDPDQWTMFRLWAPYLPTHAFMPAYRIGFADAAGTHIYVAKATGDVVQHVTRRQRALGYGAVVHWMAPTWLRMGHSRTWRRLVNALAALGFVGSLSGLVLGVSLFRWRPRGSVGRGSPYRGWLRWHHVLGLCFGLFACTWVGSGFIAMDALGWTTDVDLEAEQAVLRGGPLDLGSFARTSAEAKDVCGARGLDVRELRFVQLVGAPFYQCVESPSKTLLVSATTLGAVEAFDTPSLERALRKAHAGRPVRDIATLDAYDAYYYPTWEDKTVNGPRRLPVVRVQFNDPLATLLYVDPHTGAPVAALGPSSRRWRWWFHALHSFDVAPFYSSRPAWDVVMLPLMFGGSALSVVSLVVAVRRVLGRRRSL